MTSLSALEQLRTMSTIVADTGDAVALRLHQPDDCTTNPSLVLAALQGGEGTAKVRAEVTKGRARGLNAIEICDHLTVAIGAELAGLVPGRVSTEVDPHFSFDIEGSIKSGHSIVEEYERRGISSDRVLIKLAATWEGIRAAEALEQDGINCNLTLVFSIDQAKACADVGAFIISPFVGRITDWHKESSGVASYSPDDDPGVRSVRGIYNYFKANNVPTIVMGASFRNVEQVKALAGCDRLTISPKLLAELAKDYSSLERLLTPSVSSDLPTAYLDEKSFRWNLNENAMATEKLSEGIRNFTRDYNRLAAMIEDIIP